MYKDKCWCEIEDREKGTFKCECDESINIGLYKFFKYIDNKINKIGGETMDGLNTCCHYTEYQIVMNKNVLIIRVEKVV